ncbi:hypothetical protein RAMLITH_11295 [Ramlibacter sp. RBP-2]|uniref:Transposase n=1 Tax=Ramlibacter lithotrophicus TaxID=2606681 RepID=A0A7X6DFV3_9BURK|nr:hypothetical protein [Ramlibacter lithotrophicus]NKE66407.1 hypothetical protein [Ramlibacter lithotrophicus]
MNTTLRIPLNASPEQHQRLVQLQAAFAQVCNALAPIVQQNRMWHRVTLHHMAYKTLREQFPQIGSQMVCNAIYSVSRTARLLFQDPASPFHLDRLQGRPLPLLNFTDHCPVYFDRHTLSVKDGSLSLYTLDGRMRFLLSLSPQDEKNFREKKLREIVLSRKADSAFQLMFLFGEAPDEAAKPEALALRQQGILPEYVKVQTAA